MIVYPNNVIAFMNALEPTGIIEYNGEHCKYTKIVGGLNIIIAVKYTYDRTHKK